MTDIFSDLNQISHEIPIVLLLHPRTKKMLKEYDIEQLLNTLIVIEPVGFLDMICPESNAKLVITDSGGVKKEAYFYRVPCVTLRDETEWVETVEAGGNALAEVLLRETIFNKIYNALDYRDNKKDIEEYGDGKYSENIVYHMLN